MIKQELTIGNIPSILWGGGSEHVFIAVHGNLSHKEDMVIQLLADEATSKGYQVLSFDLPEHGARKDEETLCKVDICVNELKQVLEFVKSRWSEVRLFACSMGAYFSLLAYPQAEIKQALFLSPVVDMERIIRNMMTWFEVTPERLQQEGSIDTPVGQKLYWDYFCYVRDHPVSIWDVETSILYGSQDTLCEFGTISNFAEKFHCSLDIVESAEHYFHTSEQLSALIQWLHNRIT